jgi:hypothetical protein
MPDYSQNACMSFRFTLGAAVASWLRVPLSYLNAKSLMEPVRISSPESLGVATAPVRALAHDGQWLGRARHYRAATAKCPAEERLFITTCWCTPNDCCHKSLLSHRIPAVASRSTPTADEEGRVMSSWSRTSA